LIQLDKKEEKEIVPGYHGRIVHSEKMTMAFWRVDSGSPLPEHAHPNEQIMSLLKGQFEFMVNGKKAVHEPGSVVVIPPNASHSGKALTDCQIIDVFHPAREEYH